MGDAGISPRYPLTGRMDQALRRPFRSAAFKVVLDEGLDGLKMPVREVLESFFTGRDGFVGRAKGLDGFDQVIVILVQFQFDRPNERGVPGQGGSGSGAIAFGLDERAKA